MLGLSFYLLIKLEFPFTCVSGASHRNFHGAWKWQKVKILGWKRACSCVLLETNGQRQKAMPLWWLLGIRLAPCPGEEHDILLLFCGCHNNCLLNLFIQMYFHTEGSSWGKLSAHLRRKPCHDATLQLMQEVAVNSPFCNTDLNKSCRLNVCCNYRAVQDSCIL